MAADFEQELAQLQEKLLAMAVAAGTAVQRAITALTERDANLAAKVKKEDTTLDQFEIAIDELAIQLLARAPLASHLRFITFAMKISHDLERAGDEATTIARRAIELNQEPQLKPYVDIPRMARLALEMLNEAMASFVERGASRARAVIPRAGVTIKAAQASIPPTTTVRTGTKPKPISPSSGSGPPIGWGFFSFGITMLLFF
jgi:phosphate transport system protein